MRFLPPRKVRGPFFHFLKLVAIDALAAGIYSAAQAKPPQDVLVLSNGDTLHGKVVSAIGGAVTFHSDALGDVTVRWANVKELHTTQKFAVLDKTVKLGGRRNAAQIAAKEQALIALCRSPEFTLDKLRDAVVRNQF